MLTSVRARTPHTRAKRTIGVTRAQLGSAIFRASRCASVVFIASPLRTLHWSICRPDSWDIEAPSPLRDRDDPPGRRIALAGDAELDEGNIFEAVLEGWKHDVRNLWWIIDYNRQSLDAVVSDRLFGRIDAVFEMMGWRVVTLKYGRLLEAAFARPDGHHLREWIDACPNSLYSALVYKGGEGWREHPIATSIAIPGFVPSSTTITMPSCSG